MIEIIAYSIVFIVVARGVAGLLDDLGLLDMEEELEDEWSN